jgi:hypothetical protein
MGLGEAHEHEQKAAHRPSPSLHPSIPLIFLPPTPPPTHRRRREAAQEGIVDGRRGRVLEEGGDVEKLL